MRKIIIAMIDDEPDLLECAIDSWAGNFSSEGVEFFTTTSSSDLMKLSLIDILISDYFMPGMNGLLLSKKLKDIHPKMKTIIFSGYLEDKSDDDSVSFITKPDLGQMLKLVNYLVNDLRQTENA